MSERMNRTEILQEAINLTNGDRLDAHGEPLANHQRIADIWTVILGVEITPAQVALCMVGMKLARLAHKYNNDSFVDLAAYAAIAGEIY
jgi:hypothetical protein